MKPIGNVSLVLLVMAAVAISAQLVTIDFNKDTLGQSPSGFSTTLTGNGRPGKWIITKDDKSPDRANILAQVDAVTYFDDLQIVAL
jgi:hypothetical protein